MIHTQTHAHAQIFFDTLITSGILLGVPIMYIVVSQTAEWQADQVC